VEHAEGSGWESRCEASRRERRMAWDHSEVKWSKFSGPNQRTRFVLRAAGACGHTQARVRLRPREVRGGVQTG
jgi:hypothetical protein